MRYRVARSILLVLLGGAAATAGAVPQGVPAIGNDWMDPTDSVAPDGNPDPWPRADATDAGLDDMIRAERSPLEGAIAAGQVARPETGDQRILHTLRKVGGDYVVVPVFTLHLDRNAAH
ncbi:hypothetical protein [Sphingomonas solaris]|uniref:Uncharacterized protein n=1 Tax=Alterirhizorhabdus solaris TaxID=2529389 RepID=A0A558QYX6_9SPHN|nr:hypothetical protein [Sphingomonas solaris]TVV72364.1 hypothetical protein FOY91_14750 [Sphingomonas solaris]